MEVETKVEQEKEVEQKIPQNEEKTSILSSKWLKIGGLVLVILILLGGAYSLGTKKSTKTQTPTEVQSVPTATPTIATSTPTPTSSQTAQSFLEIREYGVKFALSDSIKDAYYLPATADKGYVYLKVRSLDSEPQCKSDASSTAALSKVGKDEINEMSGTKFSDSFDGATIGSYFYYIDLAQYECAESVNGKATLVKVRKAFTEASKTITAL